KYYWHREYKWKGISLIVSRTGWSSELGYEIFLTDQTQGNELWDHIMSIGEPMGLKPGHTSSIRRIEGGMLSYHADADITTNPFELRLDRLVDLKSPHKFVGKQALLKIKTQGVKVKQVGLALECDPLSGPNTQFWTIRKDEQKVGKVTSAIYSPRLMKNIALAMVSIEYNGVGVKLDVDTPNGSFAARVVGLPFYDPNKNIAKN
ncbi:MAG: glycine cleavage T C-terminal barrel domain-containing protein, partial [Paracoccaceae bacterium]|nr:glycine cleavage T C-terminal barrel domain-containing protein [Paracoccaceae bacterium]